MEQNEAHIFGGIDIGSNGSRLLIAEGKPYNDQIIDYTKLNYLRVPLRLGIDVFDKGYITPEREEMMMKTMQAYRLMMEVYKVEGYKACATSAMRDASNGMEIIDRVREQTGIDIQIISGAQEANILYQTHIAEQLSKDKAYLYIDVGGGSTEVTLYSGDAILFKESFNIGTIRMLNNSVTPEKWDELRTFIKNKTKGLKSIRAIGSGGNINKIFSLSKQKEGKPLRLELLRDYYAELSAATVEERMHIYNIRQDRADVIVYALHIYISIMRWAGTSEILVPKIGLSDGLVRMQYLNKIGRCPDILL